VIEAARRTRDRDSALGRYSIDENGLTTGPASGWLAVVDGDIVWDRAAKNVRRAARTPMRTARRSGSYCLTAAFS
jgi:hypothetical protein